ncbi:TatD family hydrolase [candidate division KSB1 bacterium]|nr:TatD family hydrolase [candidate division KSB1 bacterium]
MHFVDTHIHLDADAFRLDWELVWQRAVMSGVMYALNVAVGPESWERILRLSDKLLSVLPGIGIHPMATARIQASHLEQMQRLLQTRHFSVLGEIGLDAAYLDCPLERQEELFRQQLAWSLQYHLPVSLHIRRLHSRALRILDDFQVKTWRGIAHCFSGSFEHALEFVQRGFLISLAGPLTNPNAKNLQRIARELPLDRLVVETDSPDLPPRHLEVKRNEPALVVEIVRTLAQIRQQPLSLVADAVFQNAVKLIGVDNFDGIC